MNIDQILNSSKFHFNIFGSNFKTAVQRFRAEEAISETYLIKVWLVSEDQITHEDAIEKEALLTIIGKDNRFFHGVVNQFSLTGQDGRFYLYQAHIVPSFWHLTLNSDFRIFQEKSVVEIVNEVLKTKGFASDRYDFRLMKNYPKKRYCAQFGESDWLFITRLLEEIGRAHV